MCYKSFRCSVENDGLASAGVKVIEFMVGVRKQMAWFLVVPQFKYVLVY